MRKPIAEWHPETRTWRLPGITLFGRSAVFSETWPTSGSMRGGVAYAHPTSEPPTNAPASSSSRGLPTPAARDWRGGGQAGQLPTVVELLPTPTVSEANGIGHTAHGGMNLRHTVSLLPTPTVADSRGTRNLRTDGTPYSEGYGPTLTDAVPLLPTPRASEQENRQTKRSPSQQAGTHGLSLAAEVCELVPTPRATDGSKGSPHQKYRNGDPTLANVAHQAATPDRSTGARTRRRSTGGKPSSDGPLPGQLTIADA